VIQDFNAVCFRMVWQSLLPAVGPSYYCDLRPDIERIIRATCRSTAPSSTVPYLGHSGSGSVALEGFCGVCLLLVVCLLAGDHGPAADLSLGRFRRAEEQHHPPSAACAKEGSPLATLPGGLLPYRDPSHCPTLPEGGIPPRRLAIDNLPSVVGDRESRADLSAAS